MSFDEIAESESRKMTLRYRFPPMEEFVLDNGLRVILVPDSEQNGLVMALQVPVGRFSDPAGLEGCSELMLGLLQKGTESIPPELFSDKFEQVGATLFSDMGEEHCAVGVRMLSLYEQDLVPLFWDMICAPAFKSAEFARLRREIITSLQAEAVDPGLLANRHFYAELAGRNHPAGKFHTPDSIRRIELKDIKAFWSEYFAPGDAIFVVAGDFDPATFKNRWLGLALKWKTSAHAKSSVIAAAIEGPAQTIIRLIDKPDITQTSLVIGHHAPGELSPDRNAIALANYIFGAGNFSSRLMKRIRSDGGHTYGISSQIAAERLFGAFSITTSTQNQQLGFVLDAILSECRLLCEKGIDESELENAKRFALGNMAFQLEGIGNIADKLVWLRLYGRPNSYIENFDTVLQKIDVESINSVIRRHLCPDRLVIIAVGKKDEIASELKRFGPLKSFHYRSRQFLI